MTSTKKMLFIGAAMSGLLLTGCSSTSDSGSSTAKGQCHGVNACKGTGDCGGSSHSCHGKNSCKGKGWKKMTKADCDKKSGAFK